MAKQLGQLLLVSLSARLGVRGASAPAPIVAPNDSSVLVQESLRLRSRAEADGDQTFDLDGCPADRAYVEALKANVGGACGSSGTGLVRRVDCALSVRRKTGEAKMKEIYFMRHAQPKCCADCGLDRNGIEQVEGLKAYNLLLREGPLSNDSSKRAQIVYMSPMTRTMETAVRIFGDAGIPMVIDHRLVESSSFTGVPTPWCKKCVMKMCLEQGRMDLYDEYERLTLDEKEGYTLSAQDPNVRIAKFVHHLMHSPEDRIVVVSHHILLDNFRLGMSCMNMGETILKFGLSEDGWYAMSPLSCADRRRRWQYGNYLDRAAHKSKKHGDASEGKLEKTEVKRVDEIMKDSALDMNLHEELQVVEEEDEDEDEHLQEHA